MQYQEYQKSALRHLVTCKQLLSDVERDDVNTDTGHKLIQEAYYLSGYVLEALLSFSVCSYMHVTGDCMKSIPFTSEQKQFKTHDLTQKYRYAKGKGLTVLKDLCFFAKPHKNRDLQKLFTNWDVKYRYETNVLVNKKNLTDFIGEIDNIYKFILKNFTR